MFKYTLSSLLTMEMHGFLHDRNGVLKEVLLPLPTLSLGKRKHDIFMTNSKLSLYGRSSDWKSIAFQSQEHNFFLSFGDYWDNKS